MKRLKKLFRISSTGLTTSQSNNNFIEKHLTANETPQQLTPVTESIPISDKYRGIDEEQLYWILENKELNGEQLTAEEENFLEDQGCAHLGRILHEEHTYGRSKAISELVNNNYQILPEEYGNPFKELINFTLKYFEFFFANHPIDAEKLLQNVFPIMHHYIQRQIYKQHSTIIVENNIDEQKAYDEFLVFCKNVYCSLYPDKKSRNEQIKRQFKILHNDLIRFIEEEE